MQTHRGVWELISYVGKFAGLVVGGVCFIGDRVGQLQIRFKQFDWYSETYRCGNAATCRLAN